ncbi:BTAD domain-containing putative transcriptional regulator [Streptomyces sp. NPDC048825]|uniref:AfsR/SARP family transcriptional regulator n=1 Tax=Streptomyces sp. NPDC048825 TaxID=3365592 RepID=UPI0037182BB3
MTLSTGQSRQGRLTLLGAFELSTADDPLPMPRTAQRLLAFLGLASPVDRMTAAGRLWPDVTGPRAACSLRTALSKVHRLAGKAENGTTSAIIREGTTLGLDSSITIDAQALRQVAAQVAASTGSAVDAALRLLDLRGELLPSWDEEWLTIEREELREIRLQALEQCSIRLCRSGSYAAAMMLAYEALRSDPLRESSHRQLIAIHLAQGNRAQALVVYRACVRQLRRECGTPPSSLLRGLLTES